VTTIFARIIAGEMPADKVFENERVLVIKDIHPKAPVHLLIIPKKEIADLQSVAAKDLPLIGEMISIAQLLASEMNISEGYRLIINNGPLAGQTVSHLHIHLLGGDKLREMG